MYALQVHGYEEIGMYSEELLLYSKWLCLYEFSNSDFGWSTRNWANIFFLSSFPSAKNRSLHVRWIQSFNRISSNNHNPWWYYYNLENLWLVFRIQLAYTFIVCVLSKMNISIE